MPKMRVDQLLVERGLVDSRSLAQRLVMAGQVRANGQVVAKPAVKVDQKAELSIDHGPRFVSRGGDKLAGALETFDVQIEGKVCADVGASTGGFTDCLLQNGADKVYAIDVGHGILHWKMRNHPKVVVMERTNARYVEILPEPIDLITIDASFISLKILLPVVKGWFAANQGEAVVLIKPQLEAGRKEVARGDGIIRKPEIHRRVLGEILVFAEEIGFGIKGVALSPIKGPKGNIEFLAWLSVADARAADIQAFIDEVVESDEDELSG
jgi:23S rRNA (cytidine1920-2'-O)/16S rRNA (cytidine1409-2'-O)-methyltransferase